MKWLRPLLRRSVVEREMDSELRFHYQRLVDDFVADGMTQEEARRRATLEFGGMDQVKEEARDAWLVEGFCRFWRGMLQSARSLAHSPGFTIVAILMLALGIGANTEIFSLLDQMILRNLPVKDPERLVAFRSPGGNPGMDRNSGEKLSFSYPKYQDFRDRCDVFEGVLARYSTSGSLTYRGATEIVGVDLVSGNYFNVLGVKPALGRLFSQADDQIQMGHPVVVLSYFYWQKRFGGDPSIIGQKVSVNGASMTVIGVSAPKFTGIDRASMAEIRVPMMMKNLVTPDWRGGLEKTDRFWAWLHIVGRIKPGISLEQAEERANVFYRQILKDEAQILPAPYLNQREEFTKRRLELLSAASGLNYRSIKESKKYILALGAMTGIVLLIACVNLAGLLLARASARQRELAIRLALGAGRLGVVRHLLTENLILAAAGGTIGILLTAMFGKPLMEFLISPGVDAVYSTTPDLRVLLFALSLTVLTAIALAFAPLFQIRQTQLTDSLKPEGGGFAGGAHVRFRKALVILQIAFCVWLMIAAGLFARSLAKLKMVDLGFRKENLIIFYLDPSLGGYETDQSFSIIQRVEESLAAVPGISAAGLSDFGIMMGKGINLDQLEIEGFMARRPEETWVYHVAVTPGYMRALGLRLLAGRDFNPADMKSSNTTIVNQAFADKYCGSKNPVGRHMHSAFNKNFDMEIVGLVENQKYYGPRQGWEPFYYRPSRHLGGVTYYLRTSQPAQTLISTVRKIVERQAPGVPIYQLQSMESRVDRMLDSDKQMAVLASFFGIFAMILAAIGLYGIMAYTVAQRTREIGIRMALGSPPSKVLGMVIREVGLVVGLGLLIGIPSGLAASRLIESQLYDISPADPIASIIAALVVSAVGLLAGLAPARRATRIDPLVALRWE